MPELDEVQHGGRYNLPLLLRTLQRSALTTLAVVTFEQFVQAREEGSNAICCMQSNPVCSLISRVQSPLADASR